MIKQYPTIHKNDYIHIYQAYIQYTKTISNLNQLCMWQVLPNLHSQLGLAKTEVESPVKTVSCLWRIMYKYWILSSNMTWLWHIYNMYRYTYIYIRWRTINNHDMSYRQNLVHGEGTSSSRVGPYRFCSGGTLYKPSWWYRFGYRFRVGPYRFCSNGNPTTLSILLCSYLILSDTHMYCTIILPCTNLYRNLQCFHQLVKSKSSFIKLSVNTSHILTAWQMHCWKAVRMTAQSFQAVARKKRVGFVKSRNRNCSSKRTNLYQKTAVKLMVRMNEKGFCIIIFSLSFNATSVMASRDACETKSVSLQISLLATVPCFTWTLNIL